MALDAKYQKYPYLARFGQNRHTVEIILSGLYNQSGHLSGQTSIELPGIDGQPEEYMTATDAVSFVLEWCNNNNVISSAEYSSFQNNAFKSPTATISKLFTAIQKRVVEPEHLLTSRLVANMAEMDHNNQLTQVAPSQSGNPLDAYRAYNRQLMGLDQAFAGNKIRLNALVPQGLTASTGGLVTPDSIEQIIKNNFSDIGFLHQESLRRYENIADDQKRAQYIGEELHGYISNIIQTSSPALSSYSYYSNNGQDYINLGVTVTSILNGWEQNGGSLESFAASHAQAAMAIPLLLPSRGEAHYQLINSLAPKMGLDQARQVADQIVRQLSRSAGKEVITPEGLIAQAAKLSGVDPSQISQITDALKGTPILASLEYEFSKSTQTHGKLRSILDSQLQSAGIDPTLVNSNFDVELRKLGITPGTQKENHDALIARLNKARLDGASPSVLEEYSRLITNNLYDHLATNSEKGLVNLSKANHKLLAWRTKIGDAEDAFMDKWFNFEDSLPWNKASRYFFENSEKWGKAANHAIWKVTDKLGLPQIPIFGFVDWAMEKWHGFKKSTSISWLKSLRGTTTPWGKAIQFSIRHYIKGGLDSSGAWSSASHELISKGYKWAITAAKKRSLYQKAASWGAKAFGSLLTKLAPLVAKFSAKLIVILAGFASVIGTIFSALGLLSMAVDFVIKPLFGFVKKFVSDPVFALFSGLAAGAAAIPAVAGSVVAAVVGGLGAALGGFAGLVASLPWIIGGVIIFGLIAFASIFTVPNVDPGSGGGLANSSGPAGSSGSTHINIDKSVKGSFNGDKKIDNSNVDQTLAYTVTITATDIPLADVTLEDTSTLTTKGGSNPVGTPQKQTIPALAAGESTTIEYTQKLDSSFRDSYLNNSVTVTASSQNGSETKSYSLGIIIGTPPILPTGTFAVRLAAVISGCYGNIVTMSDGGACLKSLNDPQISSIISTLVGSANSYEYLQCVGFTEAVLSAAGYPSLGGNPDGNAAGYLTSPPSAYTLFKGGTPIAGDVFLMGYDQVSGTGHVGIVIGVAGNMVMVADANWNGKGMTRTNGQIPLSSISGFLRKK
ncbi:MAG: CHAP domain-containing protein [bacterium]